VTSSDDEDGDLSESHEGRGRRKEGGGRRKRWRREEELHSKMTVHPRITSAIAEGTTVSSIVLFIL
jgi:hypothetical protein